MRILSALTVWKRYDTFVADSRRGIGCFNRCPLPVFFCFDGERFDALSQWDILLYHQAVYIRRFVEGEGKRSICNSVFRSPVRIPIAVIRFVSLKLAAAGIAGFYGCTL